MFLCQLTASTLYNLKFDEIFYLFTGEELALGDDDEEDDDDDDIFNNSTSGKNKISNFFHRFLNPQLFFQV